MTGRVRAARGESGAGIRTALHPHELRCSSLKYLQIFLARHALLVGRLAALGARRRFHHGLLASAAALLALAAVASVAAIDLDVTTQDVERALSIARGRDSDRARFHAPYIQKLDTATVETVELVSEFRRYVLTTEDRIRKGERMFAFSTTMAQHALAPWKTRMAIIARLRFHPQNRYITVPAADIALVGNDRALIGVLRDPIMALSSGRPSDGTPVMGAVVEGVFDAVAVGEGVREFVVRLEGREIARLTFDLSRLE